MIKRQTLDDLAEGLAQALLREVQQANETGTTISAPTANAIVKLLDKIEIAKTEKPLIEPPKKQAVSRAELERLARVIKLPGYTDDDHKKDDFTSVADVRVQPEGR
jgi:hypothetical protein